MTGSFVKGTAIALSMIAGSAAYAATEYDFTGNGGIAPSYSFTEDGITVVATGEYRDNRFFPTGPFLPAEVGVHQQNTPAGEEGLGVVGPVNDNDYDIDGVFDERLVLTFSETVEIYSLDISEIEGLESPPRERDEWDVWTSTDGVNFTKVATNSIDDPFVFGWGVEVQAVAIGVDQGYDGIRVAGATIAAVPLPAGGLLLLSGLAGAGLLRRRRRS